MEETAYVAIWSESTQTSHAESYTILVQDDLEQSSQNYVEHDLTAEEVGQLLGGS